jgi:hypothetical protein
MMASKSKTAYSLHYILSRKNIPPSTIFFLIFNFVSLFEYSKKMKTVMETNEKKKRGFQLSSLEVF